MQIFCCFTKQNTNFAFEKQRKFHNLKWQCHKIFFPFSYESNAPDKICENGFGEQYSTSSRRYSNFKFEKFDFTQTNTAWSQTKLVYVEIVHIFFYILFQGKERPAKTKIMLAKLRTVLVFAKSDSAHCQSIWDFQNICLTLRSVSLTLRSISQCRVRIRAVLACAESLISRISLRRRIYPQTILACLSGGKKMPNNLVTLPL